ncbi:c-type cytochrome, partial [Solemya elarraichensis gill symbiont]
MSAEIDDQGFVRTFGVVLGVLVILAVFFAIMANMVGGGSDEDAAGAEIAKKAVADRLAPIASVAVAGKGADDAAAAPAAPKSGADVVAMACAACHTSGVANAPKIGDNAAWQPRFDLGMDAMMNTALNGRGAMPPRGGNPALSDDEVKAAVVQMLKDSGIDPDAPAAAPAPVAEAPAAAAGPDLVKGEAVYKSSCFACHGMGIAGAPKLGDANAWSARIP